DPSKPMPSSNAPSSSAGATATDFSVPRTSVNHSRTNRIWRSSSVRSTNSCWRSTALQCDDGLLHADYAASPRLRGRASVQRAALDPRAPRHAPVAVLPDRDLRRAGVRNDDDIADDRVVVEPGRV